MSDNITLPREVVEKALKAFENGCPPTCENGMIDSGGFHPWGEPALVPCPACLAFEHLRAALAAPSEDIDALRRENERLREALAWAYNLRHLRGHSDPVVIPERFAPFIEAALRREDKT